MRNTKGFQKGELDNLYANSAATLKKFKKLLFAAVGFEIDLSKPETVDNLFKFPNAPSFIDLCNNIAQLRDDAEAIVQFYDAQPDTKQGWFVVIAAEQPIEIWHDSDLILSVPSDNDLYKELQSLYTQNVITENQTIYAADLHAALVPQSEGYAQVNYDFIKYLAVQELMQQHMLGQTFITADYNFLEGQRTGN